MERASGGFDLELEQVRVRALRAYASAAGATGDAVRLEARLAELGGDPRAFLAGGDELDRNGRRALARETAEQPVVALGLDRIGRRVRDPDTALVTLGREYPPRCAGRARRAAGAAAPRPGASLRWLFLIALAACSSRTEPQADMSPGVARDRPIDAADAQGWPAWAERELPDLDLFAGGGRAVATWAGERCHLVVLNAPAEPTELVEYVLGLEVLLEPWNRCGPVAVTADAIYFVDRAHVVRWRDGVRTELLALESVYDIALASAGDALYVVTQFLFTTRVRRIDAAGVHEVATFDGGIQGVVTVGEDLVVWLGTRIIRIHEREVTTLRTLALLEPLPTIAGVTPTHLVLCHGGAFELVPVAGGASSRGAACEPGHPFDGVVRDDEVYIASYPPPTELIQSSLTGTARRVVVTSPDEIGDLTPAGAYVYYSTTSGASGLERIRWLKRVATPTDRDRPMIGDAP